MYVLHYTQRYGCSSYDTPWCVLPCRERSVYTIDTAAHDHHQHHDHPHEKKIQKQEK